MTLRLEAFPEVVIEHLAYNLDPKDLDELSLTSKSLYKLLHENNIWRSKTVRDFGDLFEIYTIFNTSASEISLDSELVSKFGKEPASWRQYYISKNKQNDEEDAVLIDQADHEYSQAQVQLKSFQENGNMNILSHVASKMIWILDVFPAHGGCYYILGFVLFVLNHLEEATILLQMGRAVDPTFEPFDDLEDEIERIVAGYRGEEDLLTEDNQLSPILKDVLSEIFKKFDQDGDNALNTKELDRFIFTTNGSHPPLAFLRQMGLRFGANTQGWLTKEGFLAFYLEQTLDDPSETRNDLNVHNYDPQSLRLKMEE
ncbi:hypothetical protein BY458DRAFT_587060 [Sporodiniella umbellata]|nr:hypothetical protein BY458DRAFT_587060 [Sporodiniella umbellata]